MEIRPEGRESGLYSETGERAPAYSLWAGSMGRAESGVLTAVGACLGKRVEGRALGNPLSPMHVG